MIRSHMETVLVGVENLYFEKLYSCCCLTFVDQLVAVPGIDSSSSTSAHDEDPCSSDSEAGSSDDDSDSNDGKLL